HALLAAEFNEGGHAIAKQLDHGEPRVELERRVERGVARLEVAGIARDGAALLGHADFEKRLAEIERPTGVADQPVGSAMAGVNMGVDETRADQLAARIDGPINRAIKGLANMEDVFAFVDDDTVLQQRVPVAVVRDDPFCLDQRPHPHTFLSWNIHFVTGADRRYRCMPQRCTVCFSMKRNMTASTINPIRMTASSPAKTRSVSSSERASKMSQPRPPERDDTPTTSSAAISVRQAKAQPIFRPARIEGNAAGIRIKAT